MESVHFVLRVSIFIGDVPFYRKGFFLKKWSSHRYGRFLKGRVFFARREAFLETRILLG